MRLSLLSVFLVLAESRRDLTVLLVGSRYKLTEQRVDEKRLTILEDCEKEELSCSVFDALNDFSSRKAGYPLQGMWTILPAILKLPEVSEWIIIAEDTSTINVTHLRQLRDHQDANLPVFRGFGLRDKEPTITHHFGMNAPADFLYPLLSAGLILSKKAIELIRGTEKSERWTGFAIDPNYEFALLLHKTHKLRLEHDARTFCNGEDSGTCLVQNLTPQPTNQKLRDEEIHVMIKTFGGHHKTRITVLKDTWTRSVTRVDYCSDTVDETIPTLDMGVANTEKGHCGKTWAIFRRFLGDAGRDAKWLLVADDDTLMSWQRLKKMLEVYDPKDQIIIGERYGFGFSVDGESGYDYPTGGSGMIFSRSAVESLLQACPECAADSDPDDMTIGMCAVHSGIPIVHESRLHQARPQDYPSEALRDPISFHKFTDVDPRMIYLQYLAEDAEEDEYSRTEL